MTNSILYVILNRQDGQFIQFNVEYTDPNRRSIDREKWEIVIHHHSKKYVQDIIEWCSPNCYDHIYEACEDYEKRNVAMNGEDFDDKCVCVTDYHVGGMQWMTEKQFDRLLFAEKFI